jgi:hypothetical protein
MKEGTLVLFHFSSAGVSPAVWRASRPPFLYGQHAGRMPALPGGQRLCF